MARVMLTDAAKEDLAELDRSTQILVLKAIKKLETEPEKRGAPLGSHSSGNPTGLRKLVVGDRQWRIVYQVDDNGSVCIVWVIGDRADDKVYEMAMARLRDYGTRPLAEQLARAVDLAFHRDQK